VSVPQMARDTAALLEHIGIKQTDVFGYSMGGGVAIELAILLVPIVSNFLEAPMP
jgi:pimeloyl-ACP methyl ester carboxylesterase